MKTLLFPTDFSRNSLNAIHYGINLMKNEPFTLLLLNVYDLPVIPNGEQAVLPVNYVSEIMESSKSGLNRIKELIMEEHNVSKIEIRTISRMGPLTSAVKEVLKEDPASLIVMGTHGATGLEKILIGSNAYDIIKTAKVPVLSIPENIKFQPIKNIMFSTDFAPIENHDRLNPLIWISKKFGASINIVNVVKDGNKSSVNKSAESLKIDHFLKEVKHHFYFVEHDEVDEGIINSLDNNPYELLTMIIHDLGFFERIFHPSITRKIAMQAKIPLLTIHA